MTILELTGIEHPFQFADPIPRDLGGNRAVEWSVSDLSTCNPSERPKEYRSHFFVLLCVIKLSASVTKSVLSANGNLSSDPSKRQTSAASFGSQSSRLDSVTALINGAASCVCCPVVSPPAIRRYKIIDSHRLAIVRKRKLAMDRSPSLCDTPIVNRDSVSWSQAISDHVQPTRLMLRRLSPTFLLVHQPLPHFTQKRRRPSVTT